MSEKIGIVLMVIGFIVTALGFCSLDTDRYFTQVVIVTVIGLILFAVGGLILQIFD